MLYIYRHDMPRVASAHRVSNPLRLQSSSNSSYTTSPLVGSTATMLMRAAVGVDVDVDVDVVDVAVDSYRVSK